MADNHKLLFLVDDDAQMQELCREMLNNEQIEMKYFPLAQAALDEIKNGAAPDLVVSDLVMPKIDGLEFAKQLRKLRFEKPIVIMSGMADKTAVIRAMNLGVVAVLEKPFGVESFLYTVHQSLYSSALIELNKAIIEKYEKMISSMEELMSQYEERYVAAENYLFKSGQSPQNADEAMKFFRSIRVTWSLEKYVSQGKSEIRSMRSTTDQIKSLLDSKLRTS